MKVLIIVADDSYDNEYPMMVQALRQSGAEINTGLVSKTARVDFDLDFTEDINENVVDNYDVVAFIGGYWAYYTVMNKEMPGRFKPIVNRETFERLLTKSISNGKRIILPLALPAYAAKLGLLKGRRATVYPTTDLITILKNNGVEFINEDLVIDNNVISMKRVNVESLLKALK